MVLTAPPALAPQSLARETYRPNSAVDLLSQTVCRLSPIGVDHSIRSRSPALSAALKQLVEITMALRTPGLGGPLEATLSPQALAPYVSEEVWELLDHLNIWKATQSNLEEAQCCQATLTIPSLIPHLLWMLASSGYEVMYLIEGVRAKLYEGNNPVSVRMIRLVPVLWLTTDRGRYALDLVTQASPLPALYLPSTMSLQLMENDLDSQPMSSKDLLTHILRLTGQTQPILNELLERGREVRALIPFQSWQSGTLRLQLYLADAGLAERPTVSWPAEPPSSTFTLDDFANTLADFPDCTDTGILGHWLTFTDENWIHTLLSSYAQQVMRQGLFGWANPTDVAASQELGCATLAYNAVSLVHGPNGLFKHTFVNEPALVADIWPRLRWYLAQSSKRIMQLMGGLQAQVLSPERGWQPGTLYLRSLLRLTTPTQTWLIDLGNGKLMPTEPHALPEDAVIETTDPSAWANHQTIAALEALVNQDLAQYAPAMAALSQGTAVNLYCLDTEDSHQPAKLSLSWCFTWA